MRLGNFRCPILRDNFKNRPIYVPVYTALFMLYILMGIVSYVFAASALSAVSFSRSGGLASFFATLRNVFAIGLKRSVSLLTIRQC